MSDYEDYYQDDRYNTNNDAANRERENYANRARGNADGYRGRDRGSGTRGVRGRGVRDRGDSDGARGGYQGTGNRAYQNPTPKPVRIKPEIKYDALPEDEDPESFEDLRIKINDILQRPKMETMYELHGRLEAYIDTRFKKEAKSAEPILSLSLKELIKLGLAFYIEEADVELPTLDYGGFRNILKISIKPEDCPKTSRAYGKNQQADIGSRLNDGDRIALVDRHMNVRFKGDIIEIKTNSLCHIDIGKITQSHAK